MDKHYRTFIWDLFLGIMTARGQHAITAAISSAWWRERGANRINNVEDIILANAFEETASDAVLYCDR